MSSTTQLYKTPPGGFKRQRIQNSCDRCKQAKKDSIAEQASNICTNCVHFNVPCTHRLAEARHAKKAGKAQESIEETRPEAMGRMAKTSPSASTQSSALYDIDTAKGYINAVLSVSTPYELPENREDIHKLVVQISCYARQLENQLAEVTAALSSTGSQDVVPRPVPFQCDMPRVKEEDIDNDVLLSDSLRRLNFGTSQKTGFYGKGSNVMLLQTALKIKDGIDEETVLAERSTRAEYWSIFSWQNIPFEPAFFYEFPEPDLITDLTALYFEKFQVSFKMLHRPSFERAIKQGQHFRDNTFGCLLLTVCAVASRYSNDPRVFIEGNNELSAGWKWIRQIRPFSILSFGNGNDPCVYELQALCNYIAFILTTTSGDLAWPLLSLGVRYAQSVGVHHRGFVEGKLTAEKELWKRAFWVLIAVDTFTTANYGRPRATNPLDYNQEFPCEVDDCFWENPDPEQSFKQPEGKLSDVTFWIQLLKILRVYGIAQRSILALNKRGLEGHIWGLPRDEKVILELDSLLNQWIDGIPEHLRWNPDGQSDPIFFNQSATIYSIYYWVQIQIHRPFIPTSRDDKNGGLSYPSLAVCTNAARSCVRVLDIQSRKGIVDWSTAQMTLFSSAMVLVLNLWGGSRLGFSPNSARLLEDVNKCLNILRVFEKRWQKAGSLVDMITGLLSATEVSNETRLSQKHTRTDDETQVAQDASEPSDTPLTSMPNSIAMDSFLWSVLTDNSFTSNGSTNLPFYTEELGRTPTYPGIPSGAHPVQGQYSAEGWGWQSTVDASLPAQLNPGFGDTPSGHTSDSSSPSSTTGLMGAENITSVFQTGEDCNAKLVIEEVKAGIPDAQITFIECDLASLQSVKKAAHEFLSQSNRLDILICNAGVMALPPGLTKDGYELQFGINQLSHSCLIKILLPTLLRTAEPPNSDVRVIFLSSQGYRGHPTGGIIFKDLRTTQDMAVLGPLTRYGQSKLANILYAAELGRRYPNIMSVSVHPGVIKTGLVTSSSGVTQALTTVFASCQMVTPEEGAYNQVWTATCDRSKLVNGAYYEPVGKLAKKMREGNNSQLAEQLWEWTEVELKDY
uniref:Xylanolytic transcriptional activator regulatory domain-containing protein n=1 Tax=Moniliophthora roreri TaxID=221103 RepID=A0A0W0GB04_MONRR